MLMRNKTGTFFLLSMVTGIAGAQIRDSASLIRAADSLKTIYIYADTGAALNRTDEQGRKEGLWEKRYPNGKLRYRGHFRNGMPTGIFKYYWDNDSIQNISVYTDNGAVTHTQMFYRSGGIYATGKFENKQMDSLWSFYSESSKLVTTELYKKGKKEGKSIIYFPDGNVMDVRNWHDGMLNGLWQTFYDDGQLRLQLNLVNNKKEGRFVTYGDGSPEEPTVDGYYKNNEKDGDWLYTRMDGSGTDTLKYKNGVLTNPQRFELSQHNLDSLKLKYQDLQEQLDHPDDGVDGNLRNNFR